ncbi:hypothetical protein GIB67_030680 [Kingdonia uniflora]|uniref:EGF-like domain-containing protein n=1 Tax=Kingdonia uniflora TaxID=39325 RepID=A0A7J7NIJ1_9MAGN|nr:hypothetical protein GIB67_030680 [Kingdonia uniflora]
MFLWFNLKCLLQSRSILLSHYSGTLDFGCGTNSSPSAPAPPPPPFDLNNPCTISWCGEGSCVRNGSVANCHCNAGSDNLMGLKTFPCFKECNFGGDCKDFGFGNSASSPPPPPPPSSSNSGSSKNGTSFVPPPSPNMGLGGQTQLGGIAAPNSSTTRHAMTLLMLAAIVLSLF